MSSLSVPASGIAGHRAMAVIEARRMARHPVFLLGVALGFVVLALYVVLVDDETGVPVVLTLPLLGAFYIGLASVIAAARLTRSTEVAVEAVATAPGTEARRTLALAAAGIPPLVAGLAFSVALVVARPGDRRGAAGVVVRHPARLAGVEHRAPVPGRLPRRRAAGRAGRPLAPVPGRLGRGGGRPHRGEPARADARSSRPVAPSGGSGCRGRSSTPGTTPDGTQTLIAGNPAAYLGYLLALGALAVLGAMWHDRTARTPRFRVARRGRRGGRAGALRPRGHDRQPRQPGLRPDPVQGHGLSTRLWYLRRGVAWLPLLGGCVAAAVTALLLARWPDDAFLLAPALLACCAAAAAFAYDEDALQVVAVTPRGAGWRRANRLAVTLVPLSVWALVVALRPGDVPFWRPGWWLLGGATVLLVAGSAALASRRLVPTPGALLAPVVALAAVAPVTLSGMFSWGTLYPIGDFPDTVRTVWLGVALSGAAVCAVALRPGLRHRRAGLDVRRRQDGPGKDAGLAMRAAAIEAAPPASRGLTSAPPPHRFT